MMAQRRAPTDSTRIESMAVTVGVLLFLVYFLLPLFWVIVAITKTNTDLLSTFGLWFASPNHFALFDNFRDLFQQDGGVYSHWLLNTAIYAVTSSIGATALASLAGYAFAKYRFAGSGPLFVMILGAIMVPATALALPTYLLMSKLHLINTYWSVILPSLISPFGVYLMRVYISGAVPDDLIDAARIDGASEFRTFWNVVLPVVTPGLVTVLLFQFAGTWNNYFLPLLVLSKPDLYPITVGLANWNSLASAGGGAQILFNVVVTGAFVSVVPLIVAFLLLQRYWESGLTLGSVKGA
jgi:multiple sugar transport system permease protein